MDHRVKSIAIHQPNYIPWLGYFFKIFMADQFVFHDDVIFSPKSFTKRSLIRKEFNSQETQWLGVSVKSTKNQKISTIRINHESVKIGKHINKMEYLYHNTPYFDFYFPKLKNILLSIDNFEYLADYNIHIIKEISALLKIGRSFVKSSSLMLDKTGHDYNLSIIKLHNANLYYSGVGAKEYQNECAFKENNITLLYLDTISYLEKYNYPQRQGNFLPGLSIIDSIMNVGVEGVREIFFSMRQIFNPSQSI